MTQFRLSDFLMFTGMVIFITGMAFGVFEPTGKLAQCALPASSWLIMVGYLWSLYHRNP